MPIQVGQMEFEENLRRYYEADALSPADVKRLYAQWGVFAADDRKLAGFEPLFRFENSPAFGAAWWEERWAANPDAHAHRPITPMDRVNMFLTAEATVDPAPAPRPHRPEWAVGRWRCLGYAKDGEHFEEPQPER